MKSKHLLLPGLALGAAAFLVAPTPLSMGFNTLGHDLSAESQRDLRVYNNFSDNASNNNTTIHSNWPGWDGAELACWKAAAEWGSEVFGDGTGDPIQTVGSGGANFDAYWVGNADGIGTLGDNVISAVGACTSGVLAYVESLGSGAWRMRFCDNAWNWQDGPGNDGSWDMQGIGTHEYGHSLGLDHSASSGATMFAGAAPPAINLRSIEADDIAGVQAIYGVKSAGKPRITGVSVVGTTVTITGTNFSATNNEVRFTHEQTTSASVDPHLRVTGVSSTGGGTQIVVTAPAEAGDGNVMVKQNATGHSTLSNAWPLAGLSAPPPDPDADFVASATTGQAPFFVAFSDQSVGTGISSWSYDFGDGGTSTSRNPGYIYMDSGIYTVSLTVTGTLGTDTETKVGYITVTGNAVASATWRNGTGVNPDIFDSLTLPVLGTSWDSEIDTSSLGVGGLTMVIGYEGPWGGFVGSYGEILVNPASGWAFTSLAFIGGGKASHSVSVPNDPVLAGLGVSAQGFVNNAGTAGQLTNAWDLIVGY